MQKLGKIPNLCRTLPRGRHLKRTFQVYLSKCPMKLANYSQKLRNASSRPTILLRAGPSGELGPYLAAFFTSAAILASSAAVNPFSAKPVGHMEPSSRFALSLKPNVAYLVLNFAAAWK